MRSGNITHRIDHRQHHQPESQGNSHLGDAPVAGMVNDNCPRAGKHQGKSPDAFRQNYFHMRQSVCNLGACLHMSMRICLGMHESSRIFSALADENRLRLLCLLQRGEVCVCHLQEVLQTNQPKISRHLAYLKRAGLVEGRRDGKWMHYRIKKLESNQQKVLTETLRRLEKEAAIKKDAQRLKQIECCPSKYGISEVESKREPCGV